MLKRSKKSMSGIFNILTIVIIVVVIILILAVLFKRIADVSMEEAERTRCKASVTAYAKLKELPAIPFSEDATADASKMNCPTKYVIIESGTADEMNRDIADLMVECWDNFGEGRLKLFSATDTKFCVLCSVFEFEDKSTELKGFPAFLMRKRAPVMRNGRHPTYYEYLSGFQTSEDVIDKATKQDMSFLDGGQRYAIFFTFYKKSTWAKIKGFIVGGTIGVATVIGAGAIVVFSGGTLSAVAGFVLKYGITTAFVVGGSIGAGASEGGVVTPGADWHAQTVMVVYNPAMIKELGCKSLPITQIDERFR